MSKDKKKKDKPKKAKQLSNLLHKRPGKDRARSRTSTRQSASINAPSSSEDAPIQPRASSRRVPVTLIQGQVSDAPPPPPPPPPAKGRGNNGARQRPLSSRPRSLSQNGPVTLKSLATHLPFQKKKQITNLEVPKESPTRESFIPSPEKPPPPISIPSPSETAPISFDENDDDIIAPTSSSNKHRRKNDDHGRHRKGRRNHRNRGRGEKSKRSRMNPNHPEFGKILLKRLDQFYKSKLSRTRKREDMLLVVDWIVEGQGTEDELNKKLRQKYRCDLDSL